MACLDAAVFAKKLIGKIRHLVRWADDLAPAAPPIGDRMASLNWNLLVRQARTNAASWVILTSIYAFLAGVGFTVLLGPFPLPSILAMYATACSVLCTLLFV
jgi:hypothetical protein